MKNSFRWTLGCVLALLLLLGWARKGVTLNDQEKIVVNELVENLETRCAGRYLVDLPADAEASGSIRLEGVDITATPMPQDVYEEELWNLLWSARNNNSKAEFDDYVHDFGEVPGESKGYWFVTAFEGGSSITRGHDSKRLVRAYKWDRGYKIFIETKAYDNRNFDYAGVSADYVETFKKFHAEEPPTDLPQKTHLVLDLLTRVQGRADDVIPAEPGVCFYGGFLPGKSGPVEDVRSSFALPSRPDVLFSLKTHTDGSDPVSESMPNRLLKVRMYMMMAGGSVLRSGSVRLGEMKADELLLEGPFPPLDKRHNFLLEANTTTGGTETPYLTFEMNDGITTFLFPEGERVQRASLTDNEAVAVWDVISRTVRPRPNGF